MKQLLHIRLAKEQRKFILRLSKYFLIIIFGVPIFLLALLWLTNFFFQKFHHFSKVEWGITFSTVYAQDLGLDPNQVYSSILTDLKVKHLRIPVYWSDIEKTQGQFDFSTYDELVSEAQKNQADVVLAVGFKLPRWPECFQPDWAQNLSQEQHQEAVLREVTETVRHFKDRPNIVAWQIENEAQFKFGPCDTDSQTLLENEVMLVRSIDSRPIIMTDSGEAGSWVIPMKLGNILGISLYRTTWDPIFGYFHYPLPPVFYYLKSDLLSQIFQPTAHQTIITELQAEPWTPGIPITQTPISQQLKVFSPQQLQDNVIYADQTGFKKDYLWGVEWWYWIKQQGYPEYWNFAKQLFSPDY